jgi:hypothetical protein
MRTLTFQQQPNRSEQLAMRILEGAKQRAMLRNGEAVMRLRVLRFVAILKSAPHLITYRPDYNASVPGWPKFSVYYDTFRIEISDEVFK